MDDKFFETDEEFNRIKSQAFESYNKYWDNLEKARKGIDKYMKAREPRKNDLRQYAYGELTGPCECELGQCDQSTNEFCKADETMREFRIGNKTICEKGEEKVSEEKYIGTELESKIYSKALNLIKERQLNGNRMGIEDNSTNTNLISKHYSPLTVRKYNIINGWPLYIGLICDEDISDLDLVVNGVIDACNYAGLISNNIQQIRNVTGILSETLQNHYNSKKKNCVEGVAISLYCDKNFVQNYFGDFMCHLSCRLEYAGILNMLPHI
jgi:hypothetical protein